MQPEEALTGGNASGAVVRVGDTVRKPWTRASPGVARYLGWLASQGIAVPQPLGRDSRGRQVLQYIPGPMSDTAAALTEADLRRVGCLIRELHDASSDWTPPDGARWDVAIPAPREELPAYPVLICHNDLAPWNLVMGRRWVFIDWDGAGPSTRVWDLAYAAQAFTLNDVAAEPQAAARRLVALVDGYRAEQRLRGALPQAISRRTQAMYDLLDSSHREGREPWATMFTSGHGAHWSTVAAYVRTNAAVWAAALRQRALDGN